MKTLDDLKLGVISCRDTIEVEDTTFYLDETDDGKFAISKDEFVIAHGLEYEEAKVRFNKIRNTV